MGGSAVLFLQYNDQIKVQTQIVFLFFPAAQVATY
jgi:hypothetical protein